jgi:hypothetical protein
MKNVIWVSITSALIIVSLFFTGCSRSVPTTGLLLTDRAEIAAYTEHFNTIQDRFKIEVVYSESPVDTLDESIRYPDLVIGAYLNNSGTRTIFRSLDTLVSDNADTPFFYPNLLEKGVFDDEQLLLPVSFNLPAIMYAENEENRDIDSFILSIDELRSPAGAYNRGNGQRYTHLGFSPRWDSRYLYYIAELSGANFRQDDTGTLNWNRGNIDETIEELETWITEVNSGITEEETFSNRYIIDPFYTLLQEKRIRFAYTDSASFYELPESIRDDLVLSWVGKNKEIRVCDDVLFAGIPSQCNNPDAGSAFLDWILTADAQKLMLEEKDMKSLPSFGFAGGFSSIISVNELYMPRHYPSLLGKIPHPEMLIFPPPLPAYWERIKAEVIEPFVQQNIGDKGYNESFSEKIHSWLLQNGVL